MSIAEIIASVFGLACVVLTIRQNIWCWPTGLVQVILYIWVFFHARLYSDMGLHVIYVILQIYGWYNWLHGGRNRTQLGVSRTSLQRFLLWLMAGLVWTVGLGFVMERFTNADLPYWDAATTVLSLIAQYLMANKILESWLFWITVDVMAVGIYAVKGLYPTTALYAVFLVLAILGCIAWRRSLRAQVAE